MKTGKYITKITFSSLSHQTLRVIGDPQLTHEVLAEAFSPGSSKGDEGRLLWRTDLRHGGVVVYTVSPTLPNPDVVRLKLGGVPDSRPYELPEWSVEKGAELRFALTANPSVSRTGDKASRIVHTVPKYQIQWLTEIAPRYGFRVHENGTEVTAPGGEGTTVLNRPKHKGGPMRLTRAEFHGSLTVTDTDSFVDALVNGIGKAKAFGCGLLTVHR